MTTWYRARCRDCAWSWTPDDTKASAFIQSMAAGFARIGHIFDSAFQPGRRPHRVDVVPHRDPTVHLQLTLDATAAVVVLAKSARALEEVRWQMRLRSERTQARKDWMAIAEAAYARYGWEWPGPVPGTAWARPSGSHR